MKILAVRSVPLSRETREAWNSAGVRFLRRTRRLADMPRIVQRYGYDAVLSLGNLEGIPECGVPRFNSDETIRAVSRTAALRRTLDDDGADTRFMPPLVHEQNPGPHWHKNGGWGGAGVVYHDQFYEGCAEWGSPELQRHIDGDEYRVVTVGDKVVQASRKINVEWINGRHHFDYEWCGVKGVSRNGIIPLLHEAVALIPGGEQSVLGWDIIVGERPYIIECNTSPGVNEPTARRIVDAMENNIRDRNTADLRP